MITVNFHEVGRDKKTWSKAMKNPSESAIAKEAKRNGGIMSSEVDAEFSDNGTTGTILVGGWRQVGTFTITAP